MLQQNVGTSNLAGLLKEKERKINIKYSKNSTHYGKKHVMQLFTKKSERIIMSDLDRCKAT